MTSTNADLGNNLNVDLLKKKLKKGSKVFIQLPPPLELVKKLNLGKNSENSAIDITEDPLSFAIKNINTGQLMATGNVKDGDRIKFFLVTDTEKIKNWNKKRRYVYVFTIDIKGKTQLLFPKPNLGNEGNNLPLMSYNNENEIPLSDIFKLVLLLVWIVIF
ncbi:MAG: hypothetical protein Q8880_08990 [Bacteroidota bacterium]|nr:hypothetical protein [Bacteroidota bacterium]